MYPVRSVLRFQSSYTAVVLKDNRIYQVKSPSNEKVFFNTVDVWLQSLPGTPSVDALVVSTTESEKKQKQITKKTPTKKRFHVPNRKISRYGCALNWGRHVYSCIKLIAPALLADEAIMDAYNAFIEVMSIEYPICVYSPRGPHKYFRGISLENHDTLPVQCTILNPLYKTPSELQVTKREILAVYRAAYLPLYELIKLSIVPIIETYAIEVRTKTLVAYNTKLLMKVIHKQNRIRVAYEYNMKQKDYIVKYYQHIIQQEKNRKRRIFDWEVATSEVATSEVATSEVARTSLQPCPVCATPMCTSTCSC